MYFSSLSFFRDICFYCFSKSASVPFPSIRNLNYFLPRNIYSHFSSCSIGQEDIYLSLYSLYISISCPTNWSITFFCIFSHLPSFSFYHLGSGNSPNLIILFIYFYSFSVLLRFIYLLFFSSLGLVTHLNRLTPFIHIFMFSPMSYMSENNDHFVFFFSLLPPSNYFLFSSFF